VRGAGFEPEEAVRLIAGGVSIELRADRSGAFETPLSTSVDPTHGLGVQAFGSSGSRADTGVGVTRVWADE
jgi:hypothetical protein